MPGAVNRSGYERDSWFLPADRRAFLRQLPEIKRLPGVVKAFVGRTVPVPQVVLEGTQCEGFSQDFRGDSLQVPPVHLYLGPWVEGTSLYYTDWVRFIPLKENLRSVEPSLEGRLLTPSVVAYLNRLAGPSPYNWNQSVCLGGFRPEWKQALREDRYLDLVELIQVFLSRYNANEWNRHSMRRIFPTRYKPHL